MAVLEILIALWGFLFVEALITRGRDTIAFAADCRRSLVYLRAMESWRDVESITAQTLCLGPRARDDVWFFVETGDGCRAIPNDEAGAALKFLDRLPGFDPRVLDRIAEALAARRSMGFVLWQRSRTRNSRFMVEGPRPSRCDVPSAP